MRYEIRDKRTNELLRYFNHNYSDKAVKFFYDWATYNKVHIRDLVLYSELQPTQDQLSSYMSMKRVTDKHKLFLK